MAMAFSYPAVADTERVIWSWSDSTASNTVQEFSQWIEGEGIQLALLPPNKNIAIGEVARDDFGLRVPLTDGEISLVASEWISNTPNVFGRSFTIDLGRDRAITRVLVRPGQTALNQPEYFVRGYRIEAAKENDSDIWRLLAEQRTNFNLEIDTSADSTWIVRDESGLNISRQGRHLRFTITRQDRSNWVALGDIEVFAEGYEVEAAIEQAWSIGEQVNIGRIRWDAELTENTAFQISARAEDQTLSWPEISPLNNGELFSGAEPIEVLQLRAIMSTRDPFTTPRWRQLEVEFDRRLVASRAVGSVRPSTVTKGENSAIVYTLDLQVAEGDYGVDLIQLDGVALQVDQVLVDGVSLSLAEGYLFSTSIEDAQTELEMVGTEKIRSSATVEISGRALFLNEETVIKPKIASSEQELTDGYINWQNGQQNTASSWSVRALGEPGKLLSEITVSPRPFSPYRDGEVAFSFVVSNLTNPTDVVLAIYSLDGNRMRREVQVGAARAYNMKWDGRDEEGSIVDPGLYLYEIRVRGGGDSGGRRGTCVVAY